MQVLEEESGAEEERDRERSRREVTQEQGGGENRAREEREENDEKNMKGRQRRKRRRRTRRRTRRKRRIEEHKSSGEDRGNCWGDSRCQAGHSQAEAQQEEAATSRSVRRTARNRRGRMAGLPGRGLQHREAGSGSHVCEGGSALAARREQRRLAGWQRVGRGPRRAWETWKVRAHKCIRLMAPAESRVASTPDDHDGAPDRH